MMTMFVRKAASATLLAACGLLLISGCGGKEASPIPLKKVTGTVMFNGAPLKGGTISFMPVNGTQTAAGEIVDGKYSLSTFSKDDGITPGEYKVAVTSWTTPPDMGTEGVPAIPKKYFNSDQSGLKATVTQENQQTIDFTVQ